MKGFLNVFKVGGEWSMSELCLAITMLVLWIAILYTIFINDGLSTSTITMLTFALITTLANRADSRRVSLKFKGIEFMQERMEDTNGSNPGVSTGGESN